MGIEQYATSLISDARKRKKDDSKNELKSTLGLAFGTLIGRGVKSGIESNLEIGKEKFLKNEELMATKLKYKSAVDNSSGFLTDQTAINESGQTATEYFYGQMEPAFKEKTLQEMPTTISGKERLFDTTIRSSLMPLAEERAAEHEKGLLLAQNLDTYENFESSYAEQIKKLRPTNIIDAAVSSASRLFSGKTKAEQEQEVVTAIQKSTMNKSAIAMAAFNESYKKTKNVVSAYNYATAIGAEDIQRIADEEKDIVTTVAETHKLVNGVSAVVEITTTEDRVNNITNSKVTKVTKDNSFTNPAKDKQKDAKAMQDSTHLMKEAQSVFNSDALANYVEEVVALDLNPADIKSPEEYTKIANIFATYVTNKSNLKDTFQNDAYVAMFGALAKNGTNLNELYLSLENHVETSPEYAGITAEIEAEKKTWYTISGEVGDFAIEERRKGVTVRNKYNIDDDVWSSLNQQDKKNINNMSEADLKLKGII